MRIWIGGRPLHAPWLVALGGLLVVFLAANYRLVRGRAVPIWDADVEFAPYYILLADYARAGRLLLWNPWTNAGSPDFAEPQVGALSPIVVAIAAATGGHITGFVVYWLAIWFLSGVGILLLGRHLQAPAWGASVVAIGFLFSGFLVGHAEHTSWLYSVAWFPLMIWRLDRALLSGRWRPSFEAGALWGLSGVAGYPGLACANGAFALLWAIGRWICPRPVRETPVPNADIGSEASAHPAPLLTLLRSVVVLFVVGVLVMSPTYLGFLVEGKGFSDRASPLPRQEAIGSNALHPLALTTVVSPYLGSLPPSTLWLYTDMSSASVYMGAVVLWLAIVCLLMRPREHWHWWLFAVAILAIALSLGRSVPLRGWLYDLVLPTRYFRHAAMFRGYTIFFFAVLALIATADLARHRTATKRWHLIISAALLAIVGIATFYVVCSMAIDDNGPIRGFRAQAHIWGIWLGIVAASVAAEWITTRRQASVLPVSLVLLAALDGLCAQRLPVTIETHDPAAVEEWRQLDGKHHPGLDLTGRGINRVLSVEDPDASQVSNKNLPSKTPVLRGYSPFENRFHAKWVKDPVLRSAATGESRFWFAREVGRVTPSDASFEAFARRSSALQTVPLVIHAGEAMLKIPRAGEQTATDAADRAVIEALPPAQRIPVSVTVYQPEELILEVTAPSEGWLLITDRWARGWRAEVNGQAVAVAAGDFIFRALPVRAGLNRVRLKYHPFGIPWLVVLSWGILAGVAGWSATSACWPMTGGNVSADAMLRRRSKVI